MTDLLSRAPSLTRPTSHRPLPATAALAALAAAGIGLGLAMAVGVIGWFLADAGTHGSTLEGLRAGVDGWLLGHGSRTVVGGTPLGIVPLGITMLLALTCFRCGRWAGQRHRGAEPLAVATGLGLGVVCYTTVAVVAATVNTHENASPSLPWTLLGALLLSAVFLGAGLAVGTGLAQQGIDRTPGYVRIVAEGALSAALMLLATGALVVAIALMVSFNDASMLMSSMRLGWGDALMVVAATALVAPNLALFGTAWLIGPGFAVGTQTTVSPAEVTLGPLPNFPILAALPQDGQVAAPFALAMAVPVVIAAVAAGRAQARYGVRAWDSSALRGFGVGFGAALLVALAMLLAGGPMGTGRLAQIGPPVGEVLVVALGGMGIGGLVGALLVTAWQRLRDRRGAGEPVR